MDVVRGGEPSRSTTFNIGVLVKGGPIVLTPECAELTFFPTSMTVPAESQKSEPFTIQASGKADAGRATLTVNAEGGPANTNDLPTVSFQVQGVRVIKKKESKGDDDIDDKDDSNDDKDRDDIDNAKGDDDNTNADKASCFAISTIAFKTPVTVVNASTQSEATSLDIGVLANGGPLVLTPTCAELTFTPTSVTVQAGESESEPFTMQASCNKTVAGQVLVSITAVGGANNTNTLPVNAFEVVVELQKNIEKGSDDTEDADTDVKAEDAKVVIAGDGSEINDVGFRASVKIVIGSKTTKTTSLFANVPAEGGALVLTPTCSELTFTPTSVTVQAGDCESEPFTMGANNNAAVGHITMTITAVGGANNTNALSASPFEVGVELQENIEQDSDDINNVGMNHVNADDAKDVIVGAGPEINDVGFINLIEMVIGSKTSTLLFTNVSAEGGPLKLTPTCAELTFTPTSVTVQAGKSESDPFTIQDNDNAVVGQVFISIFAVAGAGNTNNVPAYPFEVSVELQEEKDKSNDDNEGEDEAEYKTDDDTAAPVFVEPQMLAMCALHCLNTMFQTRVFNRMEFDDAIKALKQHFLRDNGYLLDSVGVKFGDASGNYSIEVCLALLRHNDLLVELRSNDWNTQLGDLDSSTKGFIIASETHYWCIAPIGGYWYQLDSLFPEQKPRIDDKIFRKMLKNNKAVYHVISKPGNDASEVCPIVGCTERSDVSILYCNKMRGTEGRCGRAAGHPNCLGSLYASWSSQQQSILCRPCANIDYKWKERAAPQAAPQSTANHCHVCTLTNEPTAKSCTICGAELTPHSEDEDTDGKNPHVDTGPNIEHIKLQDYIKAVIGGKPSHATFLCTDVPVSGGSMVLTPSGAGLVFTPTSVTIQAGSTKSNPFTVQASDEAKAGDLLLSVAAVGKTNQISLSMIFPVAGVHVLAPITKANPPKLPARTEPTDITGVPLDHASKTDHSNSDHVIVNVKPAAPLNVVIGETCPTSLVTSVQAYGGPIILTPTCAELTFTPAYVTVANGSTNSQPFRIQASNSASAGEFTITVEAVRGPGNTNHLPDDLLRVRGAMTHKGKNDDDVDNKDEDTKDDELIGSTITTIDFTVPVQVAIGGESIHETKLHTDVSAEGGPINLTPTCPGLTFIPPSVTVRAGASESTPFKIQASGNSAIGEALVYVAAVGGAGNRNKLSAHPFEARGVLLAYHPECFLDKRRKSIDKAKAWRYLVKWIGSDENTWELAADFDKDPMFKKMIANDEHRWKLDRPPDPGRPLISSDANTTDSSLQPIPDKDASSHGLRTSVLPTPPAPAAEENNFPEVKKQTAQEEFAAIAANAILQAEADTADDSMRRTRSTKQPRAQPIAASTGLSIMTRSKSAGRTDVRDDAGPGESREHEGGNDGAHQLFGLQR
jgi:hypothetical protein